jgi:hypothetical protein
VALTEEEKEPGFELVSHNEASKLRRRMLEEEGWKSTFVASKRRARKPDHERMGDDEMPSHPVLAGAHKPDSALDYCCTLTIVTGAHRMSFIVDLETRLWTFVTMVLHTGYIQDTLEYIIDQIAAHKRNSLLR